ncbi:MAG: hypothetical protein KKA42_15635 [candidate division Zixibacteria bacterium]|nr:hypothetical protein [candidate division Zixibacteria bacterium]
MSDITITRLNEEAVTDAHWRAYFAMFEELRRRYGAISLLADWQHLKRRVMVRAKEDPLHRCSVFCENGRPTGWIELAVRWGGGPESPSSVSYDVSHAEAPQWYISAAGAELARMLTEQGKRRAHCMTQSNRMSDVARAWGGDELNGIDRYRLYRDRVDETVIDRWLAEGTSRNPDLRLQFFSRVPEEHINRYCELYVRFIAEMPTDHDDGLPVTFNRDDLGQRESLNRKQNAQLYTCALVDNDGVMVGYSNAYISVDCPRDVFQALTGVIGEYRGRGAAKWLKAALYRKVCEDFPGMETMYTDMRAVNEPIQVVNRQMGYVLENQGHEFLIERTAVERAVELSDGSGPEQR